MNAPSVFKTPAGEQRIMALYDDLLARWPVPYQTHRIATLQGSTFVIECGDPAAPPLVLLHGAGSNSAIWGGDVRDFAPRCHVYAVDLLGEAGRSAPHRPPWDTPAYADWLAEVFDALGLAQASIEGISQGAWTALKFAVAHPERVTALALLTPGGIVPDKWSYVLRVVPQMLLGERGRRRVVRSMFGTHPADEETLDIVAEVMRHFKPRMGVLPRFSDEELRRLTMPVLLIGGDRDLLRDLDKIAARLRGLLPDLSVTILPGAGHALLDTSGPVLDFLAEKAPNAALTPGA